MLRKLRLQAKPFEAYTELKGHQITGETETNFQADVAHPDLDWEAEVGHRRRVSQKPGRPTLANISSATAVCSRR